MRAARFHGNKDVRVEKVDPTPIGEADVRIGVAACGICGTDLHEYATGPRFTPEDTHLTTGARIPVILGHEFSGTVREVGAAVTNVSEGDRVTVNPNVPCGECRYCEDGYYNVCPDTVAIGYHTGEGGFAEQAVVPSRQVHHLPDGVSLTDGALVEPFAVGLHSVRQSGLRAGDTAAVFGCGPIGLTAVHAAREAGAKRVVAVEPQSSRRQAALEMGADDAVDPIETDTVAYVTDATAGGVDVAFDFAGVDETLTAAIGGTRRGGTVTLGALSEGTTEVDLDELVNAERRIVGTNCYGFPPQSARSEFDTVLQWLAAGDVETDAFVTGHVTLDDVVKSGFEALHGGDSDHVKLLVRP